MEHAAPVEFRAVTGRTLTGPVVNYGETAQDRRERFTPGAFASREDPLELDVQHDPAIVAATTADNTLTVTDGPRALEVRAALKDAQQGEPGSGPLEMVRRGALRGLSAAFHALDEHRADDGTRVVTKAHLVRIGLVDQGSYSGSQVELRSRMGRSFSAKIPSGKRLRCECSGPSAKWAEFVEKPLVEAFDKAFSQASAEVIATYGDYKTPLASRSRGTLRRDGPTGIVVDLPDDDAGRAALAAHESSGIVARPFLDVVESPGELVGDVMHYNERVTIRAFVLSSTDARQGWPSPTVIPHPRRSVGVPRFGAGGAPSQEDAGMAVTTSATDLASAIRATPEVAARLLAVATELVERYAPAAPESVQNEAVIRCAGYLAQQPADARRSSTVGGIESSWAATHTAALRHSGAMSLLSPWKVRRAGAIG